DRGIDPANIFEISSLTHRGVMHLMNKTETVLKTAPQFEPKQDPVQSTEYKSTPEPALTVTRDSDGTFVLTGEKVER
ncbi:GTPase ObgE, partial [Lacticaseibacillus rhamnosus]